MDTGLLCGLKFVPTCPCFFPLYLSHAKWLRSPLYCLSTISLNGHNTQMLTAPGLSSWITAPSYFPDKSTLFFRVLMPFLCWSLSNLWLWPQTVSWTPDISNPPLISWLALQQEPKIKLSKFKTAIFSPKPALSSFFLISVNSNSTFRVVQML